MPLRYSHIGFALHILQLLADRDRDRQELLYLVEDFFDRSDRQLDDVRQKFDRTLRELRECGFEIECRPYRLVESNFPVILSASQRQALYRGADFLTDLGFTSEAKLLTRLIQQSESQTPVEIRGDFAPPADYSESRLSSLLLELQQRCAQQYRFTIDYIDSQKKRYRFDLDRCELRLHDGAVYLFAFVPDFQPKHPVTGGGLVRNNCLFRVDRIQEIGSVSSSSWVMSSFPAANIRYRLTGPLALYEPRRPHEKVLQRNKKKKYVDIETVEDYPFWFRQRIMRYGGNARVLEPDWMVEEVATELRRAASLYDRAIDGED